MLIHYEVLGRKSKCPRPWYKKQPQIVTQSVLNVVACVPQDQRAKVIFTRYVIHVHITHIKSTLITVQYLPPLLHCPMSVLMSETDPYSSMMLCYPGSGNGETCAALEHSVLVFFKCVYCHITEYIGLFCFDSFGVRFGLDFICLWMRLRLLLKSSIFFPGLSLWDHEGIRSSTTCFLCP